MFLFDSHHFGTTSFPLFFIQMLVKHKHFRSARMRPTSAPSRQYEPTCGIVCVTTL